MSSNEEITQEKLDAALIAIARWADGEINVGELQQIVSYQEAAAVQRTGLANISATQMAAGNWIIRVKMLPPIMPLGRERIESLTSQ